ncbi:MAG: hypothetical protein WCP19_08665 [Chloroflexota bacterium]
MQFYTSSLSTLLENKYLYLDPGAGSMLLQIAIAAVLGIFVFVRMQWANIKKLFGKKSNPPLDDNDQDE